MTAPLVIFDWDGTVVDSLGLIVHAMREAARRLRWPDRSTHEIHGIIGLELTQAIATLYPEADEHGWSHLRERYVEAYLEADNGAVRPYSGMTELLQTLAADGRKLAVATGKSRRGLDRSLIQTGMASLFHATRCADETAGKPDPAMVLEICSELCVDVKQSIIVGDTGHDLEMARRAGARAVAVGWGAHPVSTLATWNVPVLESVDALRDLLMCPMSSPM